MKGNELCHTLPKSFTYAYVLILPIFILDSSIITISYHMHIVLHTYMFVDPNQETRLLRRRLKKTLRENLGLFIPINLPDHI